jgi:hypothetical protein
LANLIVLLPLSYLCASAYYGLFSFKVTSFYALHEHQQTEPSHLLYSAVLLTRISYAVAYNFFALADVSGNAFFKVMGPLSSMNFLGKVFNRWVFPTCLCTMILLTVTDCWSRILNCLGLRQYGFDEDYSEDMRDQGTNIIEKARRQMQKQKNGNTAPVSGGSPSELIRASQGINRARDQYS